MYHLVVLQGREWHIPLIIRMIQLISQLLIGGQNLAKEGEPLVALRKPEGIDDSHHIFRPTGTDGSPNDWYHAKHHTHNGGQRYKKEVKNEK